MKNLKYTVISLAVVIILVMAAATCVENMRGADFVSANVYGTWWFVLLWAALAVISLIYMLKADLHKRLPVFFLHISFLVILAGALTTYLTSERGSLHLRKGETVTTFKSADSTSCELGFALTLNDFDVEYYPGTDSPMDYVSHLDAEGTMVDVSMNNIGRFRGFRFTQAGYDNDMLGSSLRVLYDPWGIALTYIGYALLLFSMVVLLCGRSTQLLMWYRKALESNSLKAVALLLFLGLPLSAGAAEPRRIDRDVTDAFAKIAVYYNGRVCPVNTVAVDFVTKLSGKASWQEYDADEIFAGWTFNSSAWESVPMIRIKDKVAQKALGIKGQWASYDDFWNSLNVYKLKSPLEAAYRDGDADMVKHLRDADEKFNVIRMFYNGGLLRMFPYTGPDGRVSWLAPGQKDVTLDLPEKEWNFVRRSMDYLTESVSASDNARAVEIAGKIIDYQRVRASQIMPSELRLNLERVYNALNSSRWQVMLYLTLSLLLAICFSLGVADRRDKMFGYAIIAVMALHLTVLLVLRWIVSGHVPLSNGFETMQFMAWSVLVLTLLMHAKFPIVIGFGPLLASFAMLVAMIGSGSPQITPLMPVLHSPLLSVHVMVIMFSYALFAMMMLVGIQGLISCRRRDYARSESLAALSHLMLYPAVFLLTAGIFIGAVWANVSWGRYWSWDPKEVWALITMLIYMAPFHSSSIKCFRSTKFFHFYCVLAFLSVLITYFGVNFLLGGMHSYA